MSRPIVLLAACFAPLVVAAQGDGTIQSLIAVIGNVGGLLVSIFGVLAFVVFFYGLAVFILNSGDEKKTEEGKNLMFWGTIALFVLVTIWGIIGLLQNTIGNKEGPGSPNIVIPRF